MKNIKRQLFILVFFILIVFNLERLDINGEAIFNLRPYFYFLTIVSILGILLLPPLQQASRYLLLILGGMAYTTLWLFFARRGNLWEDLQVRAIEFIFLEGAIWLTHELSYQIRQVDRTLQSLIATSFPNRMMPIHQAESQIKNEMARSRRHNRPLTLLVLHPRRPEIPAKAEKEHPLFDRLQRDILQHFINARLGQILSNEVRQTDILLYDDTGDFLILFPDTPPTAIDATVQRLTKSIAERTGAWLEWGAASFPQDALTLEDLMQKARQSLKSVAVPLSTMSKPLQPAQEQRHSDHE
ncbi:hypothetical protein D6833_08815 [Candidatus Parcubacteria bacterium]|nr:MAG: hypothetical protein D6833_08815 [Candidatus Parcubacteria bacterium]